MNDTTNKMKHSWGIGKWKPFQSLVVKHAIPTRAEGGGGWDEREIAHHRRKIAQYSPAERKNAEQITQNTQTAHMQPCPRRHAETNETPLNSHVQKQTHETKQKHEKRSNEWVTCAAEARGNKRKKQSVVFKTQVLTLVENEKPPYPPCTYQHHNLTHTIHLRIKSACAKNEDPHPIQQSG